MTNKPYLNLAESPFYVVGKPYTFYFSTELHMNNFNRKRILNRKEVNERLCKRYHFNVENNVLADLYLYVTIENRGFYIEDERGVIYTCREQVKLNGDKLTQIFSVKPCQSLMQK